MRGGNDRRRKRNIGATKRDDAGQGRAPAPPALSEGRFSVNVDGGGSPHKRGRHTVPNSLRLLLSVIVAVVVLAAFFVETKFGLGKASWIAAVLGAMMVVALWLFPDVSGKHEKE
jgi:hypothetical protein